MMMHALYGYVLLPLLLVLALPVAAVHRKLRDSLLARRGVWHRLREAAVRRKPARPLVWVHAASAGELLQAEPLVRRCREAGAQIAVTLTSVSGLAWTARFQDVPEVIWSDVMPLDFPWAVRRVHAALRPAVLVHVQADLWPGLVWGVAQAGTPQVLIAARCGRGSLRLRTAPGRAVYRRLYGALREIHALSEADRERLARIVPKGVPLRTAGDPGIETVLRRVREAAGVSLPPGFDKRTGPILVAGSIWPADERVLLPALGDALAALPALRAILAPHEPGGAQLVKLEAALRRFGVLRLSALSHFPATSPRNGEGAVRVVLVDSVGKLASLYAAGTVAYVGGAFSTGVHNVAEPAAAGLPVLFGPRHGNSAAAQILLERGCAAAVEDAGDLGLVLLPLLQDAARAAERGERARAAVEAIAGAAELAYEAVRRAVPDWR